MKIIVCGSRSADNEFNIFAWLDAWLRQVGHKDVTIITGEAPGVDSIAAKWAETRGLRVELYPAEWKRYGRSAGPIRNQQMIDIARPDGVIAFHGNAGTADMIKRAKFERIPVRYARVVIYKEEILEKEDF